MTKDMNFERIILIGCGEHARMIIDNIEEIDNISVLGLISDKQDDVGKEVYGYPIIGTDDDVDRIFRQNDDLTGYFLAVGMLLNGNMCVRNRIAKRLDKKYRAVNTIHPLAIVSKHAQIGYGNLFEAYTKVANGAIVGNHCIINSFSAMNHDLIIGNNVLIAGNVSMAGKKIGDNTIIADGASIGFKKSVGRDCIIGDGTVVVKDVPDGCIMIGNPARLLRKNEYAEK